MNKIISKDNNKIKELVKLRDNTKYRKSCKLCYVEGERIIADSPKELINSIYICEDYINKYNYIIKNFDENIIYIVDKLVYDKIKDTKNSQGIIAIFKSKLIEELNVNILDNSKFVLVLDDISDPGNLGTICRVAEAFGVDLIILTNTSCDIFNTKVIRASMSSIFRINIYVSNNIIKDVNTLKQYNYNIIGTTLHEESKQLVEYKFKYKNAIIFGNEANGIRRDLINISDDKIIIPMTGKIESLNVAISTAIICYEGMKQNKYEFK